MWQRVDKSHGLPGLASTRRGPFGGKRRVRPEASPRWPGDELSRAAIHGSKQGMIGPRMGHSGLIAERGPAGGALTAEEPRAAESARDTRGELCSPAWSAWSWRAGQEDARAESSSTCTAVGSEREYAHLSSGRARHLRASRPRRPELLRQARATFEQSRRGAWPSRGLAYERGSRLEEKPAALETAHEALRRLQPLERGGPARDRGTDTERARRHHLNKHDWGRAMAPPRARSRRRGQVRGHGAVAQIYDG